jgi:predicted nucleotidyltransferase
MTMLDTLIRKRATDRLSVARERADRILQSARENGVKITVVGSLARNDFQIHSDIDLLVHGNAAPPRRAMVERLVAQHMRGVDIPYDLIFEADISADRLVELNCLTLQESFGVPSVKSPSPD